MPASRGGVCRDVVTPRFLESSSEASATDASPATAQAALYIHLVYACVTGRAVVAWAGILTDDCHTEILGEFVGGLSAQGRIADICAGSTRTLFCPGFTGNFCPLCQKPSTAPFPLPVHEPQQTLSATSVSRPIDSFSVGRRPLPQTHRRQLHRLLSTYTLFMPTSRGGQWLHGPVRLQGRCHTEIRE